MLSPFPPPGTAPGIDASILIQAPPGRVRERIVAVSDWPLTFAKTIESAQLVERSGDTLAVAVRHRSEGDVLNLLTPLGDSVIVLAERKSRFDAWFRLTLEMQGADTRLKTQATLRFRGVYRPLSLVPDVVLGPIVRRRMQAFLLAPLKCAAEAAVARHPEGTTGLRRDVM